MEFMVGDQVWPKVSTMNGVMRFGKRGKLSPWFLVLFEILRGVGEIAYELAFPPRLLLVHSLFHVSMLCKCILDKSHLFSYDSMVLGSDLTYDEEPVAILDR